MLILTYRRSFFVGTQGNQISLMGKGGTNLECNLRKASVIEYLPPPAPLHTTSSILSA